jgi:hypothetical protein
MLDIALLFSEVTSYLMVREPQTAAAIQGIS